MNLTLSKKSSSKSKEGKKDVKGFFQRLARGLMLPISLLPMAGLALGVGASIVNNTDVGSFWNYLGLFFQLSGDVIFGNLPLLFGISIAITFTEDSGAAGITAVAAWLVFNGAQKALIDTGRTADYTLYLSAAEVQSLSAEITAGSVTITNTDIATALTAAQAAGTDLNMGSISMADADVLSGELATAANTVSGLALTQDTTYINGEGDASYKIVLFGQNVMFTTSQFTQNDGILSLNTSVFGGLVVGGVVAGAFNKWNEKQMPPVVGFWSGTRFVLSAAFVLMLPLALLTLLVWPWIGLGLYWLGIGIGSIPYGFDSFLFGIIERSLIPFGLHHVFYTPLWYTQAGGVIDANAFLNADAIAEINIIMDGSAGWVDLPEAADTVRLGDALNLTPDAFGQYEIAQGDQNMWFFVNENANTWFQADYVNEFLGVNPGQYMQGKYAFMIFALPAAGAAMIMAAPKGEDRKVAQSVIIAAAFTAALTGITEPIEFTFLFLAPWLFWGFHAIMAGFSFMFMDVLGANIGMTFSGGLIDIVLYGLVPQVSGFATDFYWAFVIGAVYAPIYYFVFYFAITKFDIQTPGRGGNSKLYSKADFNSRESSKGSESSKDLSSKDKQRTTDVVEALGGYSNLVTVDACITRLRVKVSTPDKVSKDKLMGLGAAGVVGAGTKNIQAIFGGEADILKTRINKIRKSGSQVDAKETKATNTAQKTSTTAKAKETKTTAKSTAKTTTAKKTTAKTTTAKKTVTKK